MHIQCAWNRGCSCLTKILHRLLMTETMQCHQFAIAVASSTYPRGSHLDPWKCAQDGSARWSILISLNFYNWAHSCSCTCVHTRTDGRTFQLSLELQELYKSPCCPFEIQHKHKHLRSSYRHQFITVSSISFEPYATSHATPLICIPPGLRNTTIWACTSKYSAYQ